VRPGFREWLGLVGEFSCAAVLPGTAVDKNIDRGIGAFGAVDVELLELGRSVGDALRRPQRLERYLAVGAPPLGDVALIEGIDRLVVGIVQLGGGPALRCAAAGSAASASAPAAAPANTARRESPCPDVRSSSRMVSSLAVASLLLQARGS